MRALETVRDIWSQSLKVGTMLGFRMREGRLKIHLRDSPRDTERDGDWRQRIVGDPRTATDAGGDGQCLMRAYYVLGTILRLVHV